MGHLSDENKLQIDEKNDQKIEKFEISLILNV